MSHLLANHFQARQNEVGGESTANFEVNPGKWLFLMCKQSIHRGDWKPFGDGDLRPPRFPLTCEPGCLKLLTAAATPVNGVAPRELRARLYAVAHTRTLTQINTPTGI